MASALDPEPDFDSVRWYRDWTDDMLRDHREASLRQAELCKRWGGRYVRRNVARCLHTARRYAAEIARRGAK
jgi:hypothetical protein